MPTTTIGDLPEELLDSILRHVEESSSTAEFWNYLGTCRQWHRVGLAIHERLDYSVSTIIESQSRRQQMKEEDDSTAMTLSSDFTLNGSTQLFLQELRSLTVHINHARNASPVTATLGGDFFGSLADSFVLSRKLSTFSLKFAADGWDFPSMDVPAIAQSHLAQLVAALPETIVNLELDTAGAALPPSGKIKNNSPERHLCHQLSKILCRLRYLRLRTGHLCQSLVGPGRLVECSCGSNTSVCSSIGTTHCAVAKTWKMQQICIWLPWGHHEEDSTLAISLRRITKLSPSPPLTTIVCQNHSRAHYMGLVLGAQEDLYPNFVWEAKANMKDADGYQVRRASVFIKDKRRRESYDNKESCEEHRLLTKSPRRYFQLGSELYPQCPFAHMAEWYLESGRRWAQDAHGGCRYPVSEANKKNSPFWKASHDVPPPGSAQTVRHHLGCGTGLYHCLFPGCRTRCESIAHLRGHLMYAHPERPHDTTYEGALPCPSVGCARVGSLGFYHKQDLEEHLLDHHIGLCTLGQTVVVSGTTLIVRAEL
ncbi:hypothetical protein BDV96DRAFT_7958 [Lophiotrema nucula]|uniref:C2H2-type domain-containing protein n=1 Tax=Lophiotrema nucula TaxID=690887 RepID=A0A6A5ZV93_9PLEO|nr:hypothetical protein BDV96DRAFT_7958 [Lophiotrema nucula]